MALYRENPPNVFRLWTGEKIGGVWHPREIETAWSTEELEALKLFVPASAEPPPEGKVSRGQSVKRVDGVVRFVNDLEDAPRRLVRKSLVQSRLIDAGLMEAAYAALTANPTYFARWFAPDHPEVYADDPDALLLLAAIGADAQAIMAPGAE